MISNKNIDNGKSFDWGKASESYAKYRDIYPDIFYEKLRGFGIAEQGTHVLDIGTGTGVLPRNMYGCGCEFTGIDISANQIAYAENLAGEEGKNINFFACAAEDADFSDNAFDAATACQCFFYFNHSRLAPKMAQILKPGGKFAVAYMMWLPFEDKIALSSERLVLKYNPSWSGGGETRHCIPIPEVYNKYFSPCGSAVFDVKIPFTRESWNGRINACRGIGASLDESAVHKFSEEHLRLLKETAPETFDILHYCAISVLQKKK